MDDVATDPIAWYAEELGQETRTIDPNGVEHGTTYDPFGRPIASRVVPVGGAEQMTSQTRYWESTASGTPAYFQTRRFNPTTVSVRYESTVLDGFGGAVQTWMPGEVATNIVTDQISDIFGNAVRTSRPRRIDTFDPNFSATKSDVFQSWTDHDAL